MAHVTAGLRILCARQSREMGSGGGLGALGDDFVEGLWGGSPCEMGCFELMFLLGEVK